MKAEAMARQHQNLRFGMTAAALLIMGWMVCRPPVARAGPLQPDELLLVFNNTDKNSRNLALYYARQRGVPEGRFCPVTVDPAREEIMADAFEREIRLPVRRFIDANGLAGRIRCIVTFYGVPIRVAAEKLTPERTKLLDGSRRAFERALRQLEEHVHVLEGLGSDQAQRTPPARMPGEKEYPDLVARYYKARQAAWDRISAERIVDRQTALRAVFLESVQAVEGSAGVIRIVKPDDSPEGQKIAAQVEQYRQAVEDASAQIDMIRRLRIDDPRRDTMYGLIEPHYGLTGALSMRMADVNEIRVDETVAAVDSELTLVLWDDYRKYRWIPNTLQWRLRADPSREQHVAAEDWDRPVLMVSRIDGASPVVAKRLIDDAIKAEREGLSGSVYLDARGIKKGQGLGEYDDDLVNLAQHLWKHTDLRVRLDNKPAVFQPGDCPDTMIYCGWYSLRRYVDAFTFQPGAVAVHLASFEAISIREAGERGWCKNLLDNGAAVTIGPVAEPYLQSFPRPTEFFGLLLTGRYTLAECYAYTLPFNSWMQMLIGDPLYRPFKDQPHLTLEQVFRPEYVPEEFRTTAATAPATTPGS